jgi:drug/metabolite transporter (DMT)-like permease
MSDPAHEQRKQRLIGIGLMCGAVAVFACLDCMAKYLGGHLDTLQVVAMRFTTAFLVALLISNPFTRPGLLRTARPGLQIMRGVILVSTTICNFLAFRWLQLDEALAILFSTPFLCSANGWAGGGGLRSEWASSASW